MKIRMPLATLVRACNPKNLAALAESVEGPSLGDGSFKEFN